MHDEGCPATVCQVQMHLDPRFAPRLQGCMIFAVPATVLLSRITAHTRCVVQQDGAGTQVAMAALGLAMVRTKARDDDFPTVIAGRSDRSPGERPCA
ncbi:hypothetical protein QTI66_34760 [Variovorax sp. J22R133]|uniref:hypothetical protein n=1 Tax=Variovorax brevis TaxID=3053503 RepID=UPI002576E3DD|nr:hypothetical protein [Variovorax sp. J22R133]MDM0117282.1 hypothetical protein [Variovorax sp. J22R133]